MWIKSCCTIQSVQRCISSEIWKNKTKKVKKLIFLLIDNKNFRKYLSEIHLLNVAPVEMLAILIIGFYK